MKANTGTLQTLRNQGIYSYDPSAISQAISCLCAYNYRYERGLVLKNPKPAYALDFGSSGHKSLETWEKTKRADNQAIKTFVQEFKSKEEPPGIGRTGKELQATYSTIYGCSLLIAYFNKYRNDKREIIDIELTLAEELIPGVYLCGRIDKLMKSRCLTFADYKFTKYPDRYLTLPSLQFMTYAFLTNKLTGERVAGELDLLGISKTKSPDDILTRIPFEYTDDQINAWKKSIVYWINQINKCRENNHWPQSWQCQPYFKDCVYLPLCQLADRSLVEPLISSMFEVDYWDPFLAD